MKKYLLTGLCVLLVLGSVYAQDQATYMYETIYLTPIPGKITELNAGLAAHNKKYHGEGDYAAFVQSVLTGKRTGNYVWAMGPGNFARLDSRPAQEGGHDDDWNKNVMSYISGMSNAEYWVRDDDAFYSPEEYSGDKIRVRFYKVKRGQNEKFGDMFDKILQVYREKGYNRPVSLYWNSFPTAHGRNAATVTGIPNWALFDQENTLVADFESINGEDSWAKWIEEWQSITEWIDNEVRQTIPALSGVE
ncbi:MAG: hypothetical protein IIB82_14840 [Bacteroidetes bacterium]|nr:hypothetical protein [Bacteroidota bacterium]